VRKRLVVVAAIFLLTLLIGPLIGVVAECRPWQAAPAAQATSAQSKAAWDGVKDYARGEDQSYLTVPEWYIVYSTDELGAHMSKSSATSFPYFEAIAQFWRGYYGMCHNTRDAYGFNSGYHLMLGTIGPSFTLEYAIKGVYEGTIGRLTAALSTPALAAEDRFAAETTRELGAFMHRIPWFEFPFGEKITALWALKEPGNPNLIRKWERRLMLTADYGFKIAFGWVMRKGVAAAYETELLTIKFWVEDAAPAVLTKTPDAKVIKAIPGGGQIIEAPRYDQFTQLALALSRDGARFREIAGNDTIVLSAIAPSTWTYVTGYGKELMRMPVVVDRAKSRALIEVPVERLSDCVRALERDGVVVERLYDY
jgi:hypothetical protein